ncbi:MAG TPA: protein kinase [Puia sp.]|uniref:protein kinase n=1 Tax=Puia sp. TaxID=2045100 RepID=UPI002CB3B326|nr:protein kinase [Puia sp.]HVU99527.1 protein kinase [Puia sp.]
MLLFNRYQYEPSTDCIGKGEYSLVFEALDTHIYLPVAVKVYRAMGSSEKFGFVNVNKFAGLDHPNICRYLYMGEIGKETVPGEHEKRQVCVMELLRDGDFASYYQANRQPELLRKMVLDILHGLTYLHSNRIVHRRLKPSNLLVGMTTQGPVVKITDFGLGSGKAASRDAHFSSMVMEVTRIAPEQFNPKEYGVEGSVSYHVDFWALGLAVYEAIADNDVLFRNSPRDSREQVIRNILSPTLPEKVRRLPAPFDRFVSRCLVKHAGRRPQNTRELIELLNRPVTAIPVEKGPAVILPKRDMAEVAVAPAARVVELEEEPVIEMEAPVRSIREIHPFFNRYEYDPGKALIGKGGFARVYRALDKKLNRWVALKFYKSADISERCSPTAEIRRVINLDHPNICRYLDIEEIEKENVFGEPEVTQVCVMELLDGGNLLEYYASHPTEAVLKKLLTDVLNGLAYLHKNGIVHRDIKPGNILIRETSDGPVAKITDFGVSKVLDAAKTGHSSALVVSIPYMAPEQLNLKKYGIDERLAPNLDLWALGVTIYEVITGNVLFRKGREDSNEEMMANILSPELVGRVDELPPPFREVVRRCLVKDARRRVQRAEELMELLRRPVEVAPPQVVERMPQEPVVAEEEPIKEKLVPRPEMRLIPETGPVTQDLFVPEKSWVWAEAVSAPAPDEPARTPVAHLGSRIWNDGQRIAIIAATVLILIAVYIIIHNHRMSRVLHALPVQDNATSMKYNGLRQYH